MSHITKSKVAITRADVTNGVFAKTLEKMNTQLRQSFSTGAGFTINEKYNSSAWQKQAVEIGIYNHNKPISAGLNPVGSDRYDLLSDIAGLPQGFESSLNSNLLDVKVDENARILGWSELSRTQLNADEEEIVYQVEV
jgi:hypothetical protein